MTGLVAVPLESGGAVVAEMDHIEGAVIAKTAGGCHLKVTLHWRQGDDTDR
ncbi:MAG: hypothetical protein M3460_07945 [Actinomycetota bacterium]|nr:hypothetical protein [Actinomycetota bacterium]